MKKKIWISIAAVVVMLAVLFVPIPSGTLNDGGSHVYTALTYKIVDWHHVYEADGMQIYDEVKFYPFPTSLKSIDELLDLEQEHFVKATATGRELSLGDPKGFSFSLTWDCYGISSYDSKTGKLVKTKDATNPEDYVTTYLLTAEQKQEIFDLISDLDVTSYPDTYSPHGDGIDSSPPMTLILSVNTDTIQKTITASNIALTFGSNNRKGQKFLDVCKAIRDILTETEEWKSLPEYEFFYS